MANFLRASRSVVTKRKNVIKDATKIPNPDTFVKISKSAYKKIHGTDLKETDNVKYLVSAIRKIVGKAKAGKFKTTWKENDYKNKFLPARFANQVFKEVTSTTGGKITMKLTAPDRLLVNPENAPDSWESSQMKIFEEKQKDAEWKRNSRNAVIGEQVGEDCRYILPEFYQPSCMSCHSGAEGKRIHKGKIEGIAGDIGGAISITFKSQKGC